MNDYIERIKAKGWTVEEIAQRWEVEAAGIGENPTKRDMDALRGLPVKLRVHKSQAGSKSVMNGKKQ